MAYDRTLIQIINETARRLSQVAGSSVQIYSEDRLSDIIKFTFDQLFDKYIWPQFTFSTQATLDGFTGVVTSDLSSLLKDYSHINAIYRENTNLALPFLPANINPFIITGTNPQYIERVPIASKVFRVWPLESEGILTIRGKTKPNEFISSDIVNFDHHALVLGATADYLISDGTNIEDSQKFAQLFSTRIQELVKKLSGDVRLNQTSNLINTEWL